MTSRRSVLDTLLAIADLFERDMERAFAGTPLTRARVAVLWVLQAGGPAAQHTIADALQVSARNVSALIDALESSGHVRRAPHPTDRRAVMVEPTPLATALMTGMQREHAELEATLLAAVAPADAAAFERGVEAVAGRLAELVADAETAETEGAPTTGGTR